MGSEQARHRKAGRAGAGGIAKESRAKRNHPRLDEAPEPGGENLKLFGGFTSCGHLKAITVSMSTLEYRDLLEWKQARILKGFGYIYLRGCAIINPCRRK